MPGRCARSLVCEMKKHTSIVTTVTPERGDRGLVGGDAVEVAHRWVPGRRFAVVGFAPAMGVRAFGLATQSRSGSRLQLDVSRRR
jgi:hypothetical protein